jgi:superfamily II DNA or RNA helicase
MVGRGLRPHSGKTNCVVLDHAGTFFWHGHPTQDRSWSLSTVRKKITRTMPAEDDYKVCPTCKKVYPLQTDLCECGYVFSSASKKKKSAVKKRDGKLTLADKQSMPEIMRKQTFWKYLYEQRNKVRKDGKPYSKNFAGVKYASIFGQAAPSEWVKEFDAKNEE